MEQTNATPEFVFEIHHQETYSRGQLLLRTFFGVIYIMIPHLFVLFFMQIAGGILRFISWWIVLFTAQYPKSFFDFQVALLRWSTRINARILNLSDGYPAFGINAEDSNITLQIAHPEKLSRGLLLLRTFLGAIYVIIPHVICLMFRMIAVYLFVFVAWWAVLITGKYPKGMHDFVVGTFRWAMRINVYLFFLSDKYPPFSGK